MGQGVVKNCAHLSMYQVYVESEKSLLYILSREVIISEPVLRKWQLAYFQISGTPLRQGVDHIEQEI